MQTSNWIAYKKAPNRIEHSGLSHFVVHPSQADFIQSNIRETAAENSFCPDFTSIEIFGNSPFQDSTSESAATADTTLDITEMITARIMINNPPPNKINIIEILL